MYVRPTYNCRCVIDTFADIRPLIHRKEIKFVGYINSFTCNITFIYKYFVFIHHTILLLDKKKPQIFLHSLCFFFYILLVVLLDSLESIEDANLGEATSKPKALPDTTDNETTGTGKSV